MRQQYPKIDARPGGIALPALIALPVVLLALVVGLSSCQFVDINASMQIEGDASALAGADALTGDALLRARYNPGVNNTELFNATAPLGLFQNSQLVIQSYAQMNPVYGGFSVPAWNLTNSDQGDIIFGAYDRTLTPPFNSVAISDGMGNPGKALFQINSVKVFMRRTAAGGNAIPVPGLPLVGQSTVDSTTQSTALLDGDVIGFQPLFPDRLLPLMPFALDATTVQSQLVAFADNLAYNPTTNSFGPGSDGLPEITVNLTTNPPPLSVSSTTAATLNIGTSTLADLVNQITAGVMPSQLIGPPFFGAFILQANTTTTPNTMSLTVPGNQYFDVSIAATLQQSLSAVAATPSAPRIWPLFSGFDGSGQPIVTGFLAFRLISASTISDARGTAIQLTLQPTLLAESSSVTNPALRGCVSVPGTSIANSAALGFLGVPNQTIAKLRLVP